jgi:hypothetical protein
VRREVLCLLGMDLLCVPLSLVIVWGSSREVGLVPAQPVRLLSSSGKGCLFRASSVSQQSLAREGFCDMATLELRPE